VIAGALHAASKMTIGILNATIPVIDIIASIRLTGVLTRSAVHCIYDRFAIMMTGEGGSNECRLLFTAADGSLDHFLPNSINNT
jgi:hypothetical protein